VDLFWICCTTCSAANRSNIVLVSICCRLVVTLQPNDCRYFVVKVKCLNASVQALSGPHFLLNGLLTFGTVYQATLLILLHSPRLSIQLKVLISVAFLISRNCYLHTGAIFMPICSQHCLYLFCVFSLIFVFCHCTFLFCCCNVSLWAAVSAEFQPCRACYM